MQLPKLQPRPRSTQTFLNWRGLERRPGAGIGWWTDERNLSADRAPLMSVRRGRAARTELDGNPVDKDIIAMCGGDHPVLLDRWGELWCGGHSLSVNMGLSDSIETHTVATIINKIGKREAILYELEGDSYSGGLADLVFGEEPVDGDAVLLQGNLVWYRQDDPEVVLPFRDVGLALQAMGLPADAYIPRTARIQVHARASSIRWNEGTTLIRSGANVIVIPTPGNELSMGPVVVNVVRLASGQEMRLGQDYYWLNYSSNNYGGLTLTLCDIDGNPYPNLQEGSTEPMSQSGYWLDTGGTSVHLRMWSITTSSWIEVEGTYVKIGSVEIRTAEYQELKTGDAATLKAERLAQGTDQAVVDLLNSSHYIWASGFTDQYEREGFIVVAGILPTEEVQVTFGQEGYLEISRQMPRMDFVVECQNRLWGCRYSEADSINEIYCSSLGDPRNWEVYQGLSTDSWRASRGKAAPFTGAAVLDGHPLFFREESLEKVYPSSTGAHQIQEFDLEGVQAGSHNSLVVIEDKLFYKGRQSVMVYTGTLPQRISPQFGDWMFSDASAARAGRKYCVAMTRGTDPSASAGASAQDDRVVAVYDPATGDWHVEDEAWDGLVITWEDSIYYTVDGQLWQREGAQGSQDVDWWAETGPIDMELPEHKWITYLRLRFKLEMGATCRVYISHDDGPWLRKGILTGNRLHSRELGIWPRRCDHFRLRLEGKGGIELRSLSFRLERSELGH